MNINIQSIHFTADNKLLDFISKKLNKVLSIDDRVLSVDVFLKIDKPSSHGNKIVEIRLHSSLAELFASKQTDTFEESTDLAIQALRKQILKYKQR